MQHTGEVGFFRLFVKQTNKLYGDRGSVQVEYLASNELTGWGFAGATADGLAAGKRRSKLLGMGTPNIIKCTQHQTLFLGLNV